MDPSTPSAAAAVYADFSPPSWTIRVCSRLMRAGRRSCERLAQLETAILAEDLAAIVCERPIFIAGVARSGSTILLEALASLPGVASARYRDFPPVWFPFWWDRLRALLPLPRQSSRPRAHGDGIDVTPDSPEACDEIFWMHFFEGRHDPKVDQRLTAANTHPRFDEFYRQHIRKVLLTRGATRYLCKGNYNLMRLPYLRRLFPDARFVVPLRAPTSHVSSLVRQHKRFSALTSKWPSVSRQLARSGHFEFGPQRRAESVGDSAVATAIETEFARCEDVSAYARQWAASYGELVRWLESDADLAESVLLLPFESLCADPQGTLQRLGTHCRLGDELTDELVRTWSGRMRSPELRSTLSNQDKAIINDRCAAVAHRLGYE